MTEPIARLDFELADADLASLVEARGAAVAVLDALHRDRASCCDGLGGRPANDPLRSILGRDAFDRAVADVRAVIDSIDARLRTASARAEPPLVEVKPIGAGFAGAAAG